MPTQTLQEALDAMNTAEKTALDNCIIAVDATLVTMQEQLDSIPTEIPSVAKNDIDSMLRSIASYKQNLIVARQRYGEAV